MADEVVITGLGIVCPIGMHEGEYWQSLTNGVSGAALINSLDTTELSRSIACEVRGPLSVERPMGRASRLAVTAARQSVENAGLSADEIGQSRVSVVVGTTMGETEFIEERLTDPAENWLTDTHIGEIGTGKPGCIAANVQGELGIAGRAFDLYGACAAGNLAMTAAQRSLLRGETDIVLAGGADGFSRLAFIGFMRLRVMAESVCRPFDRDRDGLFVGEGAAMFVLERRSSAEARGARIRARVLGTATTCEDYHPTRPEPSGDGLTRASRHAMENGGVRPEDVDYVCAHGTGTPQNDAIEVKVLESCFPGGVPFSSVKALTGHTMGAAASVEAVCCVLSLEHQMLIPTWNLENVLEPCNADAIMGAPRKARLRCVMNNSAGFGGYNSSIVLAAA